MMDKYRFELTSYDDEGIAYAKTMIERNLEEEIDIFAVRGIIEEFMLGAGFQPGSIARAFGTDVD